MTRREAARRLLHVALGAGAFLLPLLDWRLALAFALLATLANLFLLPRLPWTRWLLRETPGGGMRGLVLYPATIAVLILVFRSDFRPVQAAWLALAVGDGLAPFYGLAAPRPPWPWNARKSVAASAPAFGLAFLAMLPALPWPAALAASSAGMLAESLPPPLDDNLTVPFAAALGATFAGSLAA